MLKPKSSISDSVTAAVTRPPTVESTRTSTPRPSAAIESTVRIAAVLVTGAIAMSGTSWNERSAASTRKPMMNHGTSLNG